MSALFRQFKDAASQISNSRKDEGKGISHDFLVEHVINPMESSILKLSTAGKVVAPDKAMPIAEAVSNLTAALNKIVRIADKTAEAAPSQNNTHTGP